MVRDLPALLGEKPLMVFNDSKVRKARLFGVSEDTGIKTEFLLLKSLDKRGHIWKAMVRRAKRRRPGSSYIFSSTAGDEIAAAEITGAEGEFRIVQFDRPIDDAWLDRHGHIPLPPYIKREDTSSDSERYQTVYARAAGSAAAPTAGLHFTRDLLAELDAAGVEQVFVTLHVGLGTFLPVRCENIEEHVMHEEFYSIADEAALRIERARAAGRKILAVGTTSARTLESAAFINEGKLCLRRGSASSSIFIYPGYRFKAVDALFTNFHTPESTLLMLVCAFAEAKNGAFAEAKNSAFTGAGAGAFAGREFILKSYAEAVREGYRFFSYGDAMLIV
jgi:S-adenosylmethionine:tRNA ribosyltransferase-isomerase